MAILAVVDAQIWIRTVLFPKRRSAARRIREAVQENHFELVTSEPLLLEVEEVLRGTRLMRQHDYPHVRVDRLLEELRSKAVLVEIPGELQLCRDPDDNTVIETAVVGAAVYVVSEDQDLQADEVVAYLVGHGCRVVGVGQFLRELYPPDPDEDEPQV